MFYNVDCPCCKNSIRVQVWKDGECRKCGTQYEWGDDGGREPEICFNEEKIDEDNSANDNSEESLDKGEAVVAA